MASLLKLAKEHEGTEQQYVNLEKQLKSEQNAHKAAEQQLKQEQMKVELLQKMKTWMPPDA